MKWIAVARVSSPEEAQIIAGLLRSHGIPCEVQYEAWERVVGLHLSPVDILVPEDHLEEARALLARGPDTPPR